MNVVAVGPSEGRYDDVEIEFELYALGDAGNFTGPSWKFSLKDALTDFDCSKDDATTLLVALQAVIEYLKKEIKRIPDGEWAPPKPMGQLKPRIIGLDGKEEVIRDFPAWLEPIAESFVKDMYETFAKRGVKGEGDEQR